MGVLLYWKRAELRSLPKRNWWPAILLVAAALAMHVIGFMIQQTRISILGFFVGVYGLMGLIWGPLLMKTTFFPMCLAVFCVPLGTMADSITLPLRILVTRISVGFGHELLGIEVYRNGSQILSGTGIPLYDVAPACSGIRSLTALLLLTTVYGCTVFNANWRRLLVVAAAVPLAVLGNVVRVSVVLLVYATFTQNAGAMVEQKLGFLTFAVAVICLLAISHWLREPKLPAAAHAQPEGKAI
jgi:exosortase